MIGCHSVMDRPESVSRVAPPTRIMATMRAAIAASQMRSARSCLARAGALCCRAAALWARVEVIAGLIAGPRPRLNLQPPAPSPQLVWCLRACGIPCRDAFSRVRSVRGDGAPKSAKSLWLVPRGTRAPSRRANHGVFRHRALLSSGPSRIECADRSVSQLLAGTPSGPGGSSNAARVPRCDKARRRRTSSRLTTPQTRP